jgi:hypothetical protein
MGRMIVVPITMVVSRLLTQAQDRGNGKEPATHRLLPGFRRLEASCRVATDRVVTEPLGIVVGPVLFRDHTC